VPHDELAPISVRDADGDTRVIRQRVDSRIARLGSEQGAVHSGLKGILNCDCPGELLKPGEAVAMWSGHGNRYPVVGRG
jgi:hypothetical protein